MTSPLPQPPTDNLYKFMAIAGLVLLATSVYFPLVLANRLEDQLSQNDESMNVLYADLKYLQSKVEQESRIITNSILMQNGKYTKSTNQLELLYSDDELKKMAAENLDLLHQAQVSHARTKSNLLRESIIRAQLHRVMVVQWFFICSSLFLAISGFRLWYSRIQIYLDRDLRSLPSVPHSSDSQPVQRSKNL